MFALKVTGTLTGALSSRMPPFLLAVWAMTPCHQVPVTFAQPRTMKPGLPPKDLEPAAKGAESSATGRGQA